MTTYNNDVGLDTAVLQADQLSPHERDILTRIEDRLHEAPEFSRKVAREFSAHHYAIVEDRRQRVLLLDGGRGTGKTSFLLTLINRWNHAAGDEQTTPWAVGHKDIPAPPEHVRVIRNLDFDPLPPSMPLLAGIVHAWRPLAEHYDAETFGNVDICEDDGGGRYLMDSWHKLFRVAAAGWSELPRSKGLIEDVLDREEQVRDWHYFREQWVWFVDEVIRTGICVKTAKPLPRNPAFVIVIDDVDLQVERVRQLLPALRLLAHGNVFFLVAADLEHLTQMLTFDFFGQQQRLAFTSSHHLADADSDRWAPELARAAVQKVFPLRNRWKLERLTLTQLLRYPQPLPIEGNCSESRTIHGVLDRIEIDGSRRAYPGADRIGATKAGDAIEALAEAADRAFLTLRAGSYRSAQQLWQTVRKVFEEDGRSANRRRAVEMLARLVSPDSDSPAAVRQAGDKHVVQVTTGGELAALYLPGATDRGGVDSVVVSSRIDFLYITDDGRPVAFLSKGRSHFDFTAALIAKTLQELNFPVDATTLTWTTHLTMAWTAWHWRNQTASFAWPWHTHPRPDELLRRTAQWAEYLRTIGEIAEQKNIRDRHAYAWVYYEREMFFRRRATAGGSHDLHLDPLQLADRRDFPWPELLAFTQTSAHDAEIDEWRTRTLPLLARPEIGLHPDTQEKLLSFVGKVDGGLRRSLRDERRRLATNAITVESLRRGESYKEPSDDDVEKLLQRVEQHHMDVYGREASPWCKLFERSVPATRKQPRSDGPTSTPRRTRR